MMTGMVSFKKFKFKHDTRSFQWFLIWVFEVDGEDRYVGFKVDKKEQRTTGNFTSFDILSRDLREHIRDQVTASEFLRTKEESYAQDT